MKSCATEVTQPWGKVGSSTVTETVNLSCSCSLTQDRRIRIRLLKPS